MIDFSVESSLKQKLFFPLTMIYDGGRARLFSRTLEQIMMQMKNIQLFLKLCGEFHIL
jgi:hypothetical protein